MGEKKGIFSFFNNANRNQAIVKEEAEQRQYALNQSKVDEIEEATERIIKEVFTTEESTLTDEMISFCQEKLELILDKTGFGGKSSVQNKSGNKLYLEIVESEDVGRIIGKDGNTLEALQTLVRNMAYKNFKTPIQVLLDIEDYRKRKLDGLRKYSLKIARDVISQNIKIDLKPMNAAERRFIHHIFQDHEEVKSYSVDEGSARHIVLERKD